MVHSTRPPAPAPLAEPIRLEPGFRHYAWGDCRFLPELYGTTPGETPYAEAWFGAHATLPATAEVGGEKLALDALLRDHGERLLGADTWQRYGGLPYLLKLLAAARPLSIQVHPSRAQAIAGFRRQNREGIPLDARERTYCDENHKPELLVALTPFTALSGFRPAPEIAAVLASAPELAALLPPYDGSRDSLRRLVRTYLELPEAELSPALAALVHRVRASAPDPGTREAFLLEAHREFSRDDHPDRGLLFVMLSNFVVLEPGQALFLEAGVPHAYLRGAGIELMASSDNVLRGGLTPKHVDTEELGRILRCDTGAPPVLTPVLEDGFGRYPTWVEEFELRTRALAPNEPVERVASGPETLLFFSEDASTTLHVETERGSLELSQGGACLLPHGTSYRLTATGRGRVVITSVPELPRVPTFRGRTPTRLAFGTSGLRGLVSDITDLEAYVNTRGFLDYLVEIEDARPGMPVAIGSDLRPSSDRIALAVARAARDAGFEVIHCGKLPSPALTYFALREGCPSIMVTGSHIPFDRNGIKFNASRGELLKSDEAPVLAAVERVRRAESARPANASLFTDAGMLRGEAREPLPPETNAAREAYVRRFLDYFPTDALAGLSILVYEHSAVGRELLAEILERLGARVVRGGRTPHFVAIDTEAVSDAMVAEIQALAESARAEHGALDALVSTDGDSDRPLVFGIDGEGAVHFLPGDVLGMLVAEALDADGIAVPISATDAIELHFPRARVEVVRTRIGSPWVVAAMQALARKRVVGWEANGGFLVGSRLEGSGRTLEALATRDAVLPIVTVLAEAKTRGVRVHELAQRLPRRFGNAGLVDGVPAALGRAIAARFSPNAPEVLAATFAESSVSLERAGEPPSEAEPELSARLTRIRDELATLFGYGAVERIDFLDGIRVRFSSGDVAHVRPSGNAPQLRLYALASTPERAREIVAEGLREPEGALARLLARARDDAFAAQIRENIAATTALFETGNPPALVGTVAGSAAAQRFWKRALDTARSELRAQHTLSLHEDLPVNQAFGLLLLWQRVREHVRPGEGALLAFVFGEGTRSTPFTETDNGQKPAMASFVSLPTSDGRRSLPMVELALRYFAPVESFLRRSGFEGIVVKWGDEVQIAARDLSGSDAFYADADVVRFVSMRPIGEREALHKDWVGVDTERRITAFIPRRPLAEMEALADRGLIERRGSELWGGVNLGSIALSRALLDALLEEFASDVMDPGADRRTRPDLDPQFFTALVTAAMPDPGERARVWAETVRDVPALSALEQQQPDLFARLCRVVDRFAAQHGRAPRLVALDLGEPYWGDIGQHREIFDFYTSLAKDDARGDIARALAGIDVAPDADGNRLVRSSIGRARVRRSVLVDCTVEDGVIEDSVLIGTRAGVVQARHAFDVQSVAPALTLGERAGSYKVVSEAPVTADALERVTTLFLPERAVLVRVREDTDLRDRAANYDRPILGNPISFRDAHRILSELDPDVLEARRSAEIRVVLARRLRPEPGGS